MRIEFKWAALSGAALLLGLAACSSPAQKDVWGAVKSGEVIGKRWIPGESHTVYVPGDGDTYRKEWEMKPDCWQLTLLDEHKRIGYVCIGRDEWPNIKKGDHYGG